MSDPPRLPRARLARLDANSRTPAQETHLLVRALMVLLAVSLSALLGGAGHPSVSHELARALPGLRPS